MKTLKLFLVGGELLESGVCLAKTQSAFK